MIAIRRGPKGDAGIARKGHKARYMGVRKNLFDLRRAAAIQNLEALQRIDRDAA